ncbi:MAG: hypothetical protein KJ064_15305 [Anaerolineae bacterium]|nr:hypothetical protein [Anaerolineae bacterium]
MSKPHKLAYPTPHPGQWVILNHPARFRVVACGRRFGKTELGKLDAALSLLEKKGSTVWWVSPTYKMALEVWNSLLAQFGAVAEKIDRTHYVILLPGSRTLTIRSAHDPEKLRGVGLDFLVIDEAAFCGEEVWQVLRPALSDKLGRALFLSTPRGRNWFWQLYSKGLDPLEEEWVSWQMPTRANLLIPASEIAAARRDMPERMYLQEFDAAFLDDYGVVFRGVLDCIQADPPKHRAHEPVVIGLDWGRVNDFTVAIVLGVHSRRVLAVDRFHQVNWAVQRARLRQLAATWQPDVILAEANSIGGPNIEALQSDGLPVRPFNTTSDSKTMLIDQLALAIEEKSISLPNDPVLLHELQSFEMERLPSGAYRYSAPAGGHDDCVIALALALHAAGNPRIASIRKYA